jgi:hypothetical protein
MGYLHLHGDFSAIARLTSRYCCPSFCHCLRAGIGVQQDMKRAKECFDRAMEFGRWVKQIGPMPAILHFGSFPCNRPLLFDCFLSVPTPNSISEQ